VDQTKAGRAAPQRNQDLKRGLGRSGPRRLPLTVRPARAQWVPGPLGSRRPRKQLDDLQDKAAERDHRGGSRTQQHET